MIWWSAELLNLEDKMHEIDWKFVKLSLETRLLNSLENHLDSYYFHLHAQSNEANFFPKIQFPVFSQPIDQIGKHSSM